ncbi:MAG: hypothetical protein ACR2P2_01475 [Nakamurella sp.]
MPSSQPPLGRYTFTQPTDEGLPLRDVAEPIEEEYLPDGTSLINAAL